MLGSGRSEPYRRLTCRPNNARRGYLVLPTVRYLMTKREVSPGPHEPIDLLRTCHPRRKHSANLLRLSLPRPPLTPSIEFRDSPRVYDHFFLLLRPPYGESIGKNLHSPRNNHHKNAHYITAPSLQCDPTITSQPLDTTITICLPSFCLEDSTLPPELEAFSLRLAPEVPTQALLAHSYVRIAVVKT